MKRALLIAALLCAPVAAQTPTDMTAQQRDRAESLYKEIRCPVCTAQAVAESDATLSKDLRRRINALVVAGKSDEDILQELSLTYGEDIRLRPARSGRNLPLWFAPWVFVIGGVAWVLVRRRGRA